MDERELADFYWDEIAPDMRSDGLTPDEDWPTYTWLVENGYRGFEDALSNLGYTRTEFFTDVVGLDDGSDYDWGITHEPTIKAFEQYLDELQDESGKNLSENTIRSKRSRLSKYATVYVEVHGTGDLLSPAQDDAERETEYRRAVEAFKELDERLGTNQSRRKCHGEISQFYKYLNRWYKADWNPVANVPKDFNWSEDDTDDGTPALSSEDVRTLVSHSESPFEYLMVVGLAGWGLRPNEVASLHVSQIHGIVDEVDEEHPYISFDKNRKNGPGSVTMLYGTDAVREWIGSDHIRDEWNGYLFESTQSESGHLTTKTIQNRFKDLVERAGVTVNGERPTPKMGRRFWYSTYLNAMENVAERLEIAADDQGSKSIAVIVENYINDEQDLRRMGRREMGDALDDAFDATPPYRQS